MASITGAVPRRRPVVSGSFPRSLLATAARGGLLVAAAIGVGLLLLRLTDDSAPPPTSGMIVTTDSSTTTTTTSSEVTPGGGVRQPSQVRVLLLNGARVSGLAARMASKLQAQGYTQVTTSNAPTQATTMVFSKPGFEAEAATIASLVSPNATNQPLSDPSPFVGTENVDVVVVLGTELKGKV